MQQLGTPKKAKQMYNNYIKKKLICPILKVGKKYIINDYSIHLIFRIMISITIRHNFKHNILFSSSEGGDKTRGPALKNWVQFDDELDRTFAQ